MVHKCSLYFLIPYVLLGETIFPYWTREFFKSTKFLPLINTQFGPIQGRQDYDPINEMESEFYGGIPYAEPPTGASRFRKPKKWTRKYDGILDATNFKSPCLQLNYGPVWPTFEERGRYQQERVNTSSDCLYLNLWRPHWPARGDRESNHYFSTLVILYDEDFYWNRPEDPIMSGSGQSWSNDLLVVTIGYRTGPLGYFNGSNMALYDVKMGLEWVYENIHSFRGNRSKITVLGAGTAATLATLLAMNQKHWTQQVFDRLVLMNGKGLFSPGSFQTRMESAYYSNQSALHFGCLDQGDGQPDNFRIDMQCMEGLSDEEFLASTKGHMPTVPGWWWYFNRFPWAPVIDGDIVREEVEFLLKFRHYDDENNLKFMFEQIGLDNMHVLAGVPSHAGSQGVAFLGIVDYQSASYQTVREYKSHAGQINSDLGQCGMSAILYEYNNWNDPAVPAAARRDSLIDMTTDRYHRCPMRNFADFVLYKAKYSPETGGKVWIYQFDHPYGKGFPEWMGAIDASDFVYMMGFPMNTEKNPSFSVEEAKLSLSLNAYIGNFAMYRDPNYVPNLYWDGRVEKRTPFWPEATLENGKSYLNLRAGNLTVQRELASKSCAFWHTFMPSLYNEFQHIIETGGILNLPTGGIFYDGIDDNGPKDQPYLRCKREFKYY